MLLNSASGLSPLWRVREGVSPKSFVTVLQDSEYPGDKTLLSGPGDSLDADHTQPLPRHPDGRTDWTGRERQRGAFHRPTHASRSVRGRVVHVQSPRPDTWIQAGGAGRREVRDGGDGLGVTLPFLGVQFERLGRRGVALEIGVADAKGREGSVRLSSWKVGLGRRENADARPPPPSIPPRPCCSSRSRCPQTRTSSAPGPS